jgi:hypothetical protein
VSAQSGKQRRADVATRPLARRQRTSAWRLEREAAVKRAAQLLEPTSLDEAVAERDQLLGEIRQIELQLADRQSLDRDGQVRSDAEWKVWRSRAQWARFVRHCRYDALRAWIDARGGPPADKALIAQRARELVGDPPRDPTLPPAEVPPRGPACDALGGV